MLFQLGYHLLIWRKWISHCNVCVCTLYIVLTVAGSPYWPDMVTKLSQGHTSPLLEFMVSMNYGLSLSLMLLLWFHCIVVVDSFLLSQGISRLPPPPFIAESADICWLYLFWLPNWKVQTKAQYWHAHPVSCGKWHWGRKEVAMARLEPGTTKPFANTLPTGLPLTCMNAMNLTL